MRGLGKMANDIDRKHAISYSILPKSSAVVALPVKTLMQRAILFAVCLVCLPCTSGCLIPYAFPKVDFTRALQLDARVDEARFFRVDTKQISYAHPIFVGECLTEIPVSATGQVAAQYKPSFRSGIFLFNGPLSYDYGQGKHLALRAYRPGFELVEIDSMQQVDRIAWVPVDDLAAQERAIDSLLPNDFERNHVTQVAGSKSSAHRDALLFGVAEYERLATIAETPVEQTRLRLKASKLKTRAEQ